MNKDKQNENNKKADNILKRIRSMQEEPKSTLLQSSKLRAMLTQLKDDDELVENYKDTPIYKLGYEEGFEEGKDLAYYDAEQHYEAKLKKLTSTIANILELYNVETR